MADRPEAMGLAISFLGAPPDVTEYVEAPPAAPPAVTEFLGVPPDMADWRVAELAHRKGVLATWLSELETNGGILDRGTTEYLARARRRVQTVHLLGMDLAAVHDATLIKGPMIARHMPAGVLRQSGDIGLVTRDEQTLWRVVLDVQQRRGAIVRGLSVLRAEDGDRQIGAWLKWPAEAPLLDRPMGVVVSTCTFTGDLKQVGVRNAEIEDADLLSLFAVAEERFQRKFRVGDLIDFAVLVPVLVARYGDELVEVVTAWAVDLCLAPELLQLSRLVNEWWTLPVEWLPVMDALSNPSTVESAMRRTGGRVLHSARYGVAVDEVQAPGLRLTVHSISGCELATTPVGTFVLVESAAIDEDTYQRGLAAAADLHRSQDAVGVADRTPSEPACSIYCRSESDAPAVVAELTELLSRFGIELIEDGQAIVGSWFQTFRLKMRRAADSTALHVRLREAEQALKNKYLEERGADITKVLAESVGALLRDSKDFDGVVIHLPRLLFVKDAGCVYACVLNETQALELAANRHIATDPIAAIEYIKSLEGNPATDMPESPLSNENAGDIKRQ